MAFCGIDQVTFGVLDMAECRRFLDDWGLTARVVEPSRLVYETLDGGEIVVRPHDALDLPPAIEAGSTVRQVVWGARDAAELSAAIAKVPDIERGADGVLQTRDPNGLSLAFRVSRRRPFVASPTPANAPGAHQRVDRRSPVHERARPIQIGHIVLFAADFAATRAFYENSLGFVVSDEYPGHGVFMRCGTVGEHHNLFALSRPNRAGVNHVAFTVSDIHEVIGGGIAMSAKGWRTEIGPGRHPISSAYFWYFENPLGPPLEYYADEDYCTQDWRPGAFERKPELFAEWAVAGGIDGKTRRQIAAEDKSGRGRA